MLGGKFHHSIDIVELCGGEARTSQIAVRRRLRVCPNFDLVVGINLNDPAVQRNVLNYLNVQEVCATVMAPTCGPFGRIWDAFRGSSAETPGARRGSARRAQKLLEAFQASKWRGGEEAIQTKPNQAPPECRGWVRGSR